MLDIDVDNNIVLLVIWSDDKDGCDVGRGLVGRFLYSTLLVSYLHLNLLDIDIDAGDDLLMSANDDSGGDGRGIVGISLYLTLSVSSLYLNSFGC